MSYIKRYSYYQRYAHKVIAIVRCDLFAQLALKANKRGMSDFAASATGWRDLYGATAHRSHSEGFLRGMPIRLGLCQQKSVTQPVATQASTNIGNVGTCACSVPVGKECFVPHQGKSGIAWDCRAVWEAKMPSVYRTMQPSLAELKHSRLLEKSGQKDTRVAVKLFCELQIL